MSHLFISEIPIVSVSLSSLGLDNLLEIASLYIRSGLSPCVLLLLALILEKFDFVLQTREDKRHHRRSALKRTVCR